MSSLLQFSGNIQRGRVGLQFYETEEKTVFSGVYRNYPPYGDNELVAGYRDVSNEPDKFRCPICGKFHPYLWQAFRKPIGMFGCWVVFWINGQKEAPDLSIPLRVGNGTCDHIRKMPRDAVKLSGLESAELWHRG